MTETQHPPTTVTGPWLELQVIMDRDGHWTYKSLGDAAGLSDEYVRLLAEGRRRQTPRAIRKLSDALKVPYSVLAPSPRHTDASPAIPTQPVDPERGAA